MMLNNIHFSALVLSFPVLESIAEEMCMVQELLALTEAAQVFEQIPLVAIGKLRGVDWTVITVSLPCPLPPTDRCTNEQHQPPSLPLATVPYNTCCNCCCLHHSFPPAAAAAAVITWPAVHNSWPSPLAFPAVLASGLAVSKVRFAPICLHCRSGHTCTQNLTAACWKFRA